MKKYLSLLVIFSLFLTLTSGCLKRKQQIVQKKNVIELTYYKLFDNEDVLAPLIQEFNKENRYIKINYKKFTDVEEYERLIINELAEGEGPDIFEIHNTWLPRHYRKISPMPDSLLTVNNFQDIFVDVAADDLLRDETDSEGNQKTRIYGLPLYVDTLGLFYNDQLYEEKVPSRGKPPATWAELKEDVFKINDPDNSFERFRTAGIAMGRGDNILRAVDILYLLFLQNNTNFYNDSFNQAVFASTNTLDALGKSRNPAQEALTLFSSFATPNQKNYSWNQYLADKNSAEKELATFATGKVAMIFGYSYLYQDIIDQLKALDNRGETVIEQRHVKVTAVPQLFTDQKRAYASYFAETVSRTSAHPKEAWAFLKFLISKTSLEEYHRVTKRPTSRRDMIEEQKSDPIYGPFVQQLGYARSLKQYDDTAYRTIFLEMMENVNDNNVRAPVALKTAEDAINTLLPPEGL